MWIGDDNKREVTFSLVHFFFKNLDKKWQKSATLSFSPTSKSH